MSHGWVTPWPDGRKLDCGGPEKCGACQAEKVAHEENEARRGGDPRAHPQSQDIVRRRINELVTHLGPEELNDGMPTYEGFYKIMLCLEQADEMKRRIGEMEDGEASLRQAIENSRKECGRLREELVKTRLMLVQVKDTILHNPLAVDQVLESAMKFLKGET